MVKCEIKDKKYIVNDWVKCYLKNLKCPLTDVHNKLGLIKVLELNNINRKDMYGMTYHFANGQ